MRRERFEEIVVRVIDELPEEFRSALDNVDVVVQDYPDRRQLAKTRRGMTLLGLYEGVPQVSRTQGYNMAIPDRIVIFRKPIEEICQSDAEIEAEVRTVVLHEIAHHFGLSDDQLQRIESERQANNTRY